jgi:hypothetical protein
VTSRDDRFLEMLTDSQFDDAIELMLRGIVVEPELEPVARFADEAGPLADGSPPPASPELAAVLGGEPLADDLLPVGATRAAAIARTCLRERSAGGRSGHGGAVARTSARVAAMSLAAKAGLGLAFAGAGAAGAGAAGVLPASVVDAVRHTIEVVTPFELPGRASAGAAVGADDGPGGTADATGSRPDASDESEPYVPGPSGSDAGSEGLPGASDTPRPGDAAGATSPSAESPGTVDPTATVPPPDDTPTPPDDTPTPPASPPSHGQPPPDPAGAPHPDGRPSGAGDAIPDSGERPDEAGNANQDHNPTLDVGGLPSQPGGADVGGLPSQPGGADVRGLSSQPGAAAGPSLSLAATTASSGDPL